MLLWGHGVCMWGDWWEFKGPVAVPSRRTRLPFHARIQTLSLCIVGDPASGCAGPDRLEALRPRGVLSVGSYCPGTREPGSAPEASTGLPVGLVLGKQAPVLISHREGGMEDEPRCLQLDAQGALGPEMWITRTTRGSVFQAGAEALWLSWAWPESSEEA